MEKCVRCGLPVEISPICDSCRESHFRDSLPQLSGKDDINFYCVNQIKPATKHWARKYLALNPHLDYEDLRQDVWEAYLQALSTWGHDRGAKVLSWAWYNFREKVKRYRYPAASLDRSEQAVMRDYLRSVGKQREEGKELNEAIVPVSSEVPSTHTSVLKGIAEAVRQLSYGFSVARTRY